MSGVRKAAAELTGEDAEAVFATNVIGPIRTMSAFIPLLQSSARRADRPILRPSRRGALVTWITQVQSPPPPPPEESSHEPGSFTPKSGPPMSLFAGLDSPLSAAGAVGVSECPPSMRR